MTDLHLIMVLCTIGLAVLLIVVEGAGLPRIVRRCDADAKEKWKKAILSLRAAKRGLRDAKREGAGDVVVESRRLEVTQSRDNARTACEDFGKVVDHQVNGLRDRRRESLKEATAATTGFYRTELKAKWTRIGSPTVTTVMSVAGPVLLLALASIQIRYYNLFGFDVLPYLPDYPAPALLLGLLQALLLLGLLPLFFIAGVVLVPPLALLLLIRIVDDVRALTAKGIARISLAACGRWAPCSYLALPLLDEAWADSVPGLDDANERRIRRSVEAAILFVRKYGSKLIPNRMVLIGIWWSVIVILLIIVYYIAIEVEPRYRFHAICGGQKGPRNVRVILDPPLAGEASFTRIGFIGGNVFIVPELCGRQPQTAGERGRNQPDGQRDSGDRSKVEQEPRGGAEANVEANNDGNGEGWRWKPKALLAGLQYVVDGVQVRLQFLDFSGFPIPTNRGSIRPTIDVTVVPLGRVLCMHEVRDDQPNKSAACRPLSKPSSGDLRITVQKTTDTTWTIVLPPGVRMDDEWRLREEIAERLCHGGAPKISEPILFKRGMATPMDERAAEIIRAFLTKPELQEVDLHVLGFASGDGGSQHNENLARQRAETVAAAVRELYPDRTLRKDSWGEAHLTNGVANSRSARIVGCRPKTADSADPSGQQARAVPTSET